MKEGILIFNEAEDFLKFMEDLQVKYNENTVEEHEV